MAAFMSSYPRWARPNRALRRSCSIPERMALAHTAAAFLRKQGARRVWLFGSLAKGGPQDFRSDLDLATEDLPPELYLSALGELLLRLPLPVDLVELETASPALRLQIFTSGFVLDEN